MPLLAYDRALLLLDEGGALAGRAPALGMACLKALRGGAETTFMDLPFLDVEAVEAEAREARSWATDLVVVGIGGSSLGLNAALDFLWRHREGAGAEIRVHVLESPNGHGMRELLSRIDLETTLVNVVTKSGTTIETMSNFLVLRERLIDEFGPEGYRRRVLATTDPASGMLRALAREEGLRTLPIPSGTGGRFSVLSAVGLFPLAVAGVDIRALLEGARAAVEGALGSEGAAAPCHAFAADQVQLYRDGYRQIVMLPYGDHLGRLGDWFVQLWAESLGKKVRGGEGVVGPVPSAGVGPQDQHSLFQLYMEGPDERSLVFVREAGAPPSDMRVPSSIPDALSGLAHVGGKSLDEILDMEFEAVREALRLANRRSATLTVESGARGLGALIQTLEMATAIAGDLLDVDPFNQPGVESSKRIAHALLGRAQGGVVDDALLKAFRRRAESGRLRVEGRTR